MPCNSFGNKASKIDAAMVAKVRAVEKRRAMFWNPADLLKAHPIEKEKEQCPSFSRRNDIQD